MNKEGKMGQRLKDNETGQKQRIEKQQRSSRSVGQYDTPRCLAMCNNHTKKKEASGNEVPKKGTQPGHERVPIPRFRIVAAQEPMRVKLSVKPKTGRVKKIIIRRHGAVVVKRQDKAKTKQALPAVVSSVVGWTVTICPEMVYPDRI